MKILVPILLLFLSACATGSRTSYCDLISEEPAESYSVESKDTKRSTASQKKNRR